MKQIKSLITGLTLLALLFPTVVFAAPRTLLEVEKVVRKLEAWFSVIFWVLTATFIIYAAFLFLTSRGDEKILIKAKTALLYAIIAIIVAVFAPVAGDLIRDILKP